MEATQRTAAWFDVLSSVWRVLCGLGKPRSFYRRGPHGAAFCVVGIWLRWQVARVKIDYTVSVWREGRQFIGHAMPLDVASAGDTAEAARKAVDEAVRLFIATAQAHGTLEELLEEAGYQREAGAWRSPGMGNGAALLNNTQ